MTQNVSRPRTNTVQGYIDETPLWRDGTVASASPMTGMQKRIWWLAVAGKFFEGLVVFMTGVALPLIGKEFNLTSAQHGLVSTASLFGILIGASALGGLSDRYGRKPMFIIEMALCLFGMGLALGCDYPTAHLVISESTPTRSRGTLVLSAFGFQAAGALVGTAVGYLVLRGDGCTPPRSFRQLWCCSAGSSSPKARIGWRSRIANVTLSARSCACCTGPSLSEQRQPVGQR
jgi:MFS transporter, putative metabolite transport protein